MNMVKRRWSFSVIKKKVYTMDKNKERNSYTMDKNKERQLHSKSI